MAPRHFTTRTAMRTKRSIKWSLAAVAVAVAAVTVPGCELLVDFDRSKIPQEGGTLDGTTGADSATGHDSSTGGAPSTGGHPGADSTADGGADTGTADSG